MFTCLPKIRLPNLHVVKLHVYRNVLVLLNKHMGGGKKERSRFSSHVIDTQLSRTVDLILTFLNVLR